MMGQEKHGNLCGELPSLTPVGARVQTHEFLEEWVSWVTGKFWFPAQAQDELGELTRPRIPGLLGVQRKATLQPNKQVSNFVRVGTLYFRDRQFGLKELSL